VARIRTSVATLAGWSLVAFVLSALVAAPALAGWAPSGPVEPGVGPILAFGPTGVAAIGSSQTDPSENTGGVTYVAVRPAQSVFGAPQSLAPMTYGFDPGEQSELQAIALPQTGAVVLMFASNQSVLPVSVVVEPAGASSFAPAQQLVGPSSPESNTPEGLLAATVGGEVLAVGSDDLGDVSTDSLPAGGSRFTPGAPLPALSGTGVGPQLLAVDDAGGGFVTEMGGCTAVAYRPPGGRFAVRYRDCSGPVNSVDGITAVGDGYAALLTVTSHRDDNAFYVQAGRFGRFGSRHLLDTMPTTGSSRFLGVAAGAAGNVTVGWRHCNVFGWDCAIYAAQGSVRGRFGARQLIAAGAPSPKVNLTGLMAYDAIAVQRCVRHHPCTIAAAVARRNSRFARLQPISTDGRLLQLQGDRHGDELLVFGGPHGVLYAATRLQHAPRFSAPRRLSPPGVNPSTVTSAFGPRGEAIVAWSQNGQTMAAVYDVPR
jgi:hypothetical protein